LDESTGLDAEEAMKRLTALGVGTRPFFYPMHQQPVLRRMGFFEGEHYPIAERMYRQGFYIPSGMSLNNEKIQLSAAAVRNMLNI
jgi:perosamine synthetase